MLPYVHTTLVAIDSSRSASHVLDFRMKAKELRQMDFVYLFMSFQEICNDVQAHVDLDSVIFQQLVTILRSSKP